LLGYLAAPLYSPDMGLVTWVHNHLEAGDLLVAESGFCSCAAQRASV
jgi:hypothetical protein